MDKKLEATVGWLLVIPLLFLAGFHLQEITLRSGLFVVLALSGVSIFLVPYHRAMQTLFLYIGIEGFAKIMTGYNPVVHVGADLLVCALAGRFILVTVVRRTRLHGPLPPLTPLFIAHAAWFLIAAANPYALSLMASLAAAKMYLTMPLLYFFGYYLTTEKRRVQDFILPWIVVCAIQSVSSIIQAEIGPASVLGLSPIYAVQLAKFKGYAFRPFGLTNQPGGPSIYLYMVTPLILYLFVQSRSALFRLGLLALLGSSAVALLFCQVRSAILKALVGLAGYIGLGFRSMTTQSRATRRRLLGFIVMVSLLLAVAIPRLLSQMVEGSADSKMAVERSLSLFDINKVGGAREGALSRFVLYAGQVPLGAGLSRTGAAAGKFADLIDQSPFFHEGFFTDNFWVATVVDLGLPGTLILTVLVFSILGLGLRNMRRLKDGELRIANAALLCALSAIVLGFYGAEAILYNPEASFFWFFAGVMIRLPDLDRETAAGALCAQ